MSQTSPTRTSAPGMLATAACAAAANWSRTSMYSFVSGSAAASCAIMRRAVNAGKPVTSETSRGVRAADVAPAPPTACGSRGARTGPCLASIWRTTSSTARSSCAASPSLWITHVATAILSASGSCAAMRARASATGSAVARDEAGLLHGRRRGDDDEVRQAACARFSTSSAAS